MLRCSRKLWALVVTLGLVGCTDTIGRDTAADTALFSHEAPTPGQLRWSQLRPVEGSPRGVPLFVSNNPELVEGYGILAGVPFPGLALHGAQRTPGAPEAQWSRAQLDARCPDGGMRDFGVYLAHILPASLGSGRRVTLAVVPEADTEVRVYGTMGTTDWSDGAGELLTTRSDWWGAELARRFFVETSAPRRTLSAAADELLVIDSALATSVVEGRYHIEADACLYPFTMAHAAPLGGYLPGHYAPGDVKWPGWLDGKGYGRAAGVYEGDVWKGQQSVRIEHAPSTQGIGLLSHDDSMPASAHHGDSATQLFGNYGVLIDQQLDLSNALDHCVDAKVELVSYLDRGGVPDRTPTVSLFEATPDAYTPSMFWNGPVEAITDAGTEVFDPVLRYAPSPLERGEPRRAMESMRQPLARLRLEPGASHSVRVRLPVPGYIVAPIGLTVGARPCD